MAITYSKEVFGSNIRFERRKRQWSQRELASKCGTTQTNIAMIENGHTTPTMELAVKIANTFSLGIDVLFKELGYQITW